MKGFITILGFSLLLVIHSCGSKDETDNETDYSKSKFELFDEYSNDSLRALLFEIAYNNKSTAPSYVVFKAKDLNTNLTKEICCEAPFLSGSIHTEFDIDYDTKGMEKVDSIILINKQNIYQFENEDALNNISFYDYPNYEKVIQVAQELDLSYYHRLYGKNDLIGSLHFENDTGYVQLTFAHIMFNCGIITSRACFAGNNLWFGNIQ